MPPTDPTPPPVRLLLVSGSTRRGSTNGAALRAALELLPPGAEAALHEDLAALPAFNPDDDHDPLPPAVVGLRAAIARADAVVFCTPEYAGTLPGAFKNLLDWTVGGGEIYEKPVGWINVAAEGRGVAVHQQLRVVLGYVGARFVDDACIDLPLRRDDVDGDGLVTSPSARARIAAALHTLRQAAS